MAKRDEMVWWSWYTIFSLFHWILPPLKHSPSLCPFLMWDFGRVPFFPNKSNQLSFLLLSFESHYHFMCNILFHTLNHNFLVRLTIQSTPEMIDTRDALYPSDQQTQSTSEREQERDCIVVTALLLIRTVSLLPSRSIPSSTPSTPAEVTYLYGPHVLVLFRPPSKGEMETRFDPVEALIRLENGVSRSFVSTRKSSEFIERCCSFSQPPPYIIDHHQHPFY